MIGSCIQCSNENDEQKFGKTFNQDLIDSLKWKFYAINYGGTVIFFDSLSRREIKEIPAKCGLKLINVSARNKDTASYEFEFHKNGHFSFVTLDSVAFIRRIGVYNSKIYPLLSHGKFEFTNYDSVKRYFEINEAGFADYLRSFNGTIDAWLYDEAKRRGIIK